MGRLFDDLRDCADENAVGAAAHELIAEARQGAMCRQMLLMTATNYLHRAEAEPAARAQALRLAWLEIRAEA